MWWWPLPLLLLIAHPSRFGLQIANFTQIKPHGPSRERVGLRVSTILFEGSTETANKCVKASPGLPERARARGRWVWVAKEGAELGVDLGLTELVEVPEELKHMCPAAPGEGERRPVVTEILPESVPVSPLLVLIPAEGSGRGGGGGAGGCSSGAVISCSGTDRGGIVEGSTVGAQRVQVLK